MRATGDTEPDLNTGLAALKGVAVGDSLGLVYEGLRAGRGVRLYPPPYRQRLIFGRGFVSDDTVQSGLALAALAALPNNVEAFQRHFARGLLRWFLSVPPGIGFGTVKACLRLACGFGPKRSGVNSAGNGAAMRSAVIGAAFAGDPARRIAYTEECARVSHRHPLAIQGAQIVALAAALAAGGKMAAFDEQARELAPDWHWDAEISPRGPSGYVVHTVNVAVAIVQETADFETAMARVIEGGGDTDTVGAVVGGILGAGGAAIPERWAAAVFGWPRPRDFEGIRGGRGAPYLRLLRTNVFTLPIVLAHGFRRLLPPY